MEEKLEDEEYRRNPPPVRVLGHEFNEYYDEIPSLDEYQLHNSVKI